MRPSLGSQGQALIEFCWVAGNLAIAAIVGLLVFKAALERHECARQTFQSTRSTLNFAHESPEVRGAASGIYVEKDDRTLSGFRLCGTQGMGGTRLESVTLPRIPRKSATILDPRVFRSFSSSASSP